MKIFHFFQQIQKSFNAPFIPCITLGFRYLPTLHVETFYQTLPQIEIIHSDIRLDFEEDPHSKTFHGFVEFEEHKILILGNPAPLPESIITSCIHTAHWEKSFKEEILGSKATITLVYAGNSQNPVENYIAIYKIASCFYTPNLLGVINEPAWTYHPTGLLPKLMFNNMVNLCRNSPPFLFWTGFIKTSLDIHSPFTHQKTNCFFTKGHHVLGFPDFAFYSDKVDPMKVKKLFNDIIEYAWFENKDLQPGDYVGLQENEIYELVEPDENIDFLYSPTKTFILRPMNN
ncbi:MAG: hypothetical protein KatS3mg035_1565 [Bacteroidia bacterium]|nr:MAG: hypothetical protein KatS3mg035_1565 [Bacteroidia bacterium]